MQRLSLRLRITTSALALLAASQAYAAPGQEVLDNSTNPVTINTGGNLAGGAGHPSLYISSTGSVAVNVSDTTMVGGSATSATVIIGSGGVIFRTAHDAPVIGTGGSDSATSSDPGGNGAVGIDTSLSASTTLVIDGNVRGGVGGEGYGLGSTNGTNGGNAGTAIQIGSLSTNHAGTSATLLLRGGEVRGMAGGAGGLGFLAAGGGVGGGGGTGGDAVLVRRDHAVVNISSNTLVQGGNGGAAGNSDAASLTYGGNGGLAFNARSFAGAINFSMASSTIQGGDGGSSPKGGGGVGGNALRLTGLASSVVSMTGGLIRGGNAGTSTGFTGSGTFGLNEGGMGTELTLGTGSQVAISGTRMEGGMGGSATVNENASGGNGSTALILETENSNIVISNSTMLGGRGGDGYYNVTGAGGEGVYISLAGNNLTLNSSTITGGRSGDALLNIRVFRGGEGIVVDAASTTVNLTGATRVTGGRAGDAAGGTSDNMRAGHGLRSSWVSSTITVGAQAQLKGGDGALISGVRGGGGAGLSSSGDVAVITNFGTIESGAGGTAGDGAAVTHNNGVSVNGALGLVFSNSGVVSGTQMGMRVINVNTANSIVNTASGTIIGQNQAGLYLDGSGIASSFEQLSNAGEIRSNNGSAIDLQSLDMVSTFTNTGTLRGNDAAAVRMHNTVSVSTFTNSGVISSTAGALALDGAVTLFNFTNSSSGTVIGSTSASAVAAVRTTSGARMVSVTNAGLIEGRGTAAVMMDGGTADRWVNTGVISGTLSGIHVENNGNMKLISNSGTIYGASSDGINIKADAYVDEIVNTGTIQGASSGNAIGQVINTTQGVSVTNLGTINGNLVLRHDGSNASTATGIGNTIKLLGGVVNGNVVMGDSSLLNRLVVSSSIINGDVDLSNNSNVSLTLVSGTINGKLITGEGSSSKFTATTGQGQTFNLLEDGDDALTLRNATFTMAGAGTLNIRGSIDSAIGPSLLRLTSGTTNFISTSTINADLGIQGGRLNVTSSTVAVAGFVSSTAGSRIAFGLTSDPSASGRLLLANDTARSVNLASGTIIEITGVVASSATYVLIDGSAAGSTLTAPSATSLILSSTVAGVGGSGLAYRLKLENNRLLLQLLEQLANVQPNTAQAQAIWSQINIILAGDPSLLALLQNMSDAGQLTNAINQLIANEPAAPSAGANQLMDGVLSSVQNRIGEITSPNNNSGISTGQEDRWLRADKVGLWLKGYGGTTRQGARGTGNGYDANGRGLALGVDREVEVSLADHALAGVAFGYGTGSVTPRGTQNRVGVESLQALAYGAANQGPWEVQGQASYAFNQFKSRRVVNVGGTIREALGDYQGHQFGLQGEVAHRKRTGPFSLLPKVGLNTTLATNESYTETGATGANLKLDGTRNFGLTTKLGGRAEYVAAIGNDWVLTPHAEAMYSYDLYQAGVEQTAQFASGGAAFTMLGTPSGRHALKVEIGLKVNNAKGFDTTLSYQGELRAGSQSHGGTINLRYNF